MTKIIEPMDDFKIEQQVKGITNNYDDTKGIDINMHEISEVFKYKQLPKYLERYAKQ